MQPQMYSLKEASVIYSIPKSTLQSLCREGQISYVAIGNKYYIKTQEMEDFLEERTVARMSS